MRVMATELRNDPTTFQTLMNCIFRDVFDACVVVYAEDIHIYRTIADIHYDHILLVLDRIHQHSVYTFPQKCTFLCQEDEFLGLILGRNGITVDPEGWISALIGPDQGASWNYAGSWTSFSLSVALLMDVIIIPSLCII